MTVPAPLLAFLKAAWPYLLALILGVLWARSCARANASDQHVTTLLAQVQSEADSIHLLASRDTVTLAPIIDTVPKIITRIRTLILSPVDSGWKHSDSVIALVPASDSACHTAYNGLKAGCELLRQQVVADTVTFTWIRDSAQQAKTREVQQATFAAMAAAKTDTVAKAKSCKVLFFPCPSRTLSFVAGGVGGIVAALFLHK